MTATADIVCRGDIGTDSLRAQGTGTSLMFRPLVADRPALEQVRHGVRFPFLLHAQRAADRYGAPTNAALRAGGEGRYVGGREDMIIDVAIGLSARATTLEGVPA